MDAKMIHCKKCGWDYEDEECDSLIKGFIYVPKTDSFCASRVLYCVTCGDVLCLALDSMPAFTEGKENARRFVEYLIKRKTAREVMKRKVEAENKKAVENMKAANEIVNGPLSDIFEKYNNEKLEDFFGGFTT